MALPASGTISMNDIRVELGISGQAPFNLNTARSGGYVPLNPYSPSLPPVAGQVSLASWYNYCHTCTPLYTFTVYKAANHYPQNWTSAAAACTGGRDVAWTVVSSSSTLTAGSSLYTLSGGLYVPWTVFGTPESAIWAYDGTGGKPIRMVASDSWFIAEVGACITCTEYYNFQNYDIFVYYNDCNGNATSSWIGPNQSWCAQDGTVSGDPGWGSIGTC